MEMSEGDGPAWGRPTPQEWQASKSIMADQHKQNLDEAQQQIARLVDGELTESEQHQLLLWLEAHPDQWRTCALAFVEDQVLRNALEPGSRLGMGDARVIASSEIGSAETTSELRDTYLEDRWGPASPGDRGELKWFKFFSVAATVLAAFAIGWLFEMSRHPNTLPNPTPASSVPSVPLAQDRSTEPQIVSHSEPYYQPTPRNWYVTSNDLWENESALPPELQSLIEQAGAQVRRKRGLLPAELNGRRVTLPYEDIQLVPVRNDSY